MAGDIWPKAIVMCRDNREQTDNGKLSEFWSSLRDDGCDMRHVGQMLNRIQDERAEAYAIAARVYFKDNADKPLSALDLADELHELRCKSTALELAITGARKEREIDHVGDALASLAANLSRNIERLEKAFCAELRLTNKDNGDEQ